MLAVVELLPALVALMVTIMYQISAQTKLGAVVAAVVLAVVELLPVLVVLMATIMYQISAQTN